MRLEGNRFVVTGGGGFIGSHVVDQLLESGVEEIVVFDSAPRHENVAAALASGRVRMVEGDLRDVRLVGEAMSGAAGVFHLAVLPLGACVEDERLCLDVNVVGTFNVIEAAQRANVRKIVFSSASSVYGDTPETLDEAHPFDAWTMYGASKIAGEYLLRAFYDRHGLDFVTLRYMNVYGPRQQGGLVMGALGLILAGERPVISGDGSQSFDFVHVADVAAANLRAMSSDVTAEVFNVGSGTEASVRELVERLLALTGSDLEPEYRNVGDMAVTRRVGSSERARALLGWTASRDLESGLREVVESVTGR